MGAEVWSWLIPSLVAAIAIITTILATRRYGNRSGVLHVAYLSTPLLAGPANQQFIQVTYRDIPVSDPVITTIWLQNTGPRDISSRAFDERKPIVIETTGRFYGLTEVLGAPDVTTPSIGEENAQIWISPGLLKRGEDWQISILTAGHTDVSVLSNLIDTKVVVVDDAEPVVINIPVSGPFGFVWQVPIRRYSRRRR